MGGNHKYTKYKKSMTLLLLTSMLVSVTEPFVGLTLGVDTSIEMEESGDTEVSLEDNVGELEPEKTESEGVEKVNEIPEEENKVKDVEISEEETSGDATYTEIETKDDKDEGYTVEEPSNGGEDKKQLKMMSLQSTPVYELADETEFRNPDDYVDGGSLNYLGDKQYVEIPNKIYRWDNPSYANMFTGKKVKGVKSTNKNINSMAYMFRSLQSQTLDVSQLNTIGTTNMQGMFKESKVINLDLSQFDTSMVSNMVEMFRDSKIENLDISSFNTKWITSMDRMFQDTSIKTIDITNFDTSRVKNMTGVFSGAKASTIKLGDLNTSNTTDMKEMFRGTAVKELDLSSFNTSKVINMRDMFQGSNAGELDLTSFDTLNVTDMGNMFNGAKATKIDVSSFNTENTYNVVGMFQDTKATELNLSSFNTHKITDMSRMFKGSNATKIDVSSFTTNYVTDMSEMFMDTQVKELDLSSFDMSSVNDTTDMFKGTTATKGYARTQHDADILNSSKGKPEHLHFKSRYVVPKDTDFQGSTNGAFRYIGKDEYIEMPHTIKEIPVVSYKSMFEGTSVKGVVSTNKNIKDMTRMFYGNTATNLDVSNLDTSGVTTMGSMFEFAHTNTLNVQNFDTSTVYYMGYMFKDTKMKNLDLSSFDMVNVKNTEGMFQRSTATQGYARTKEDAEKLNGSTNKPTNLNFTVWSIVVNPDTKEWTNKSVNLTAKGESEVLGIDYIDMVSNGDKGVNLIRNGDFKDGIANWSITPGNKYVNDTEGLHITVPKSSQWPRLYSNSPVFKNMKKGETYTLSYESKTDTTKGRTVNIALNTSMGVITQFYPMYIGGDWQKQQVTFTTSGDSLSINDFRLQVWLEHHMNPTESNISFRKFKLERGDTATPFSLAPEDVKLVNNQKEYEVSENGTYIFRVVDKKGNTKEVSHTVSNIDYTKPTAKLTSSPEGWTSKDVTIYVNGKDELSGVDYITLPNGTRVNGANAEYKVTENGEYTFKVTDKAGNTETFTKTVSNIDKTVPESKSTVLNKEWTNGTVDIEVKTPETVSGVSGIEMNSSPKEGRNLLRMKPESQTVAWDGWDYGLTYPIRTSIKDLGLTHGDPVTLSFNIEDTDSPVRAFLQFRDATHTRYKQYDGNSITKGSKGFTSVTTTIPRLTTSGGTPEEVKHIALAIRNSYNTSAKATFNSPKFEYGSMPTPWTPAPEDVKLVDGKKTYPVASNGIYTFKTTYNNGTTSESSVNVTNIDRESPTVTVTGNKTDWTEDDGIQLTIKAKDTQSGVKSITLPDGKVVNSDTANYTATENNDYTFIITDNVGNTTTHTEKVNRLMVPYLFYIYDTDGKPVEGYEFELLRDGTVHSKAKSDKNGLVNFGKVPPTGKYTVKQTKAPDGYVVNPDEKDVDVGDTTEPEEFISYPRGKELPGTGTKDGVVAIAGVTLITWMMYYTIRKKKNLK